MFETLAGWLGVNKKDNPEAQSDSQDFLGLKGLMENVKSFFRGAVDSLLEKLGVKTETQQQLQEFQKTIDVEAAATRRVPESGASLVKRMEVFGRNDAEVKSRLVPMTFLSRTINVHMKVRPILEKIAQQIRAYEREHGIRKTWNPIDVQCQNWRDIVGMKGKISNHSFGGTLDIDPKQNGLTYGQVDPTTGKNTNIPSYVVQAFQDNGYNWGGAWDGRKDPMHFEPSAELINSLG